MDQAAEHGTTTGPSSEFASSRRRTVSAALALTVAVGGLGAVVFAPSAAAAPATVCDTTTPQLESQLNCTGTGGVLLTVPAGAGSVTVQLTGGGGGGGAAGSTSEGGLGAVVSGTLDVTGMSTIRLTNGLGGAAAGVSSGVYSSAGGGSPTTLTDNGATHTYLVAGGGGGAGFGVSGTTGQGGDGALSGTAPGGYGYAGLSSNGASAQGGTGGFATMGGFGGQIPNTPQNPALTDSAAGSNGTNAAGGGLGGATGTLQDNSRYGGSGGRGYTGGGGGASVEAGGPGAGGGGGAGSSYVDPALVSNVTYAPSSGARAGQGASGAHGLAVLTFHAAPAGSGGGGSPVLGLNLFVGAGDVVKGATARLSGSGLKANSAYSLVLHSSPVRLAAGHARANGAFATSVKLPAKACAKAGLHRLVLTGVAPNGHAVSVTRWIVMSGSCRVLAVTKRAPRVSDALSTVWFDNLSAHLDAADKASLRRVAKGLTGAKKVVLTGYTQTDLTSAAARKANLRLAGQRAKAVAAYLRSMGVDATISTVAKGGVDPVSDRKQHLNRRVVVSATW